MLMRLRPQLVITVLCCLLLAGCGIRENQTEEAPEELPATPEPLYAWICEETPVEALSAAENFCAAEKGFYCSRVELVGEAIPDDVVNAAKRKGKEPYNDGRYDVFATKLYFISDAGKITPLEDYITLGAEENPGSWKSFSCVGSVEEITVTPSGKILTLEKNTVSGNSAPNNRAQVIPGKNYREFHTVWYIRTLTETGQEIGRVRIDEESGRDVAKLWAGKKALSKVETVAAGELPFTPAEAGTGASRMLSPVRRDGESYTFVAGSGAAEKLLTLHREEVTPEEAKVALTLMADEPSVALRQAVDEFNASQKAAYITILSPEEASQQNGTDLLAVTAETTRALAAEGLLADLYPLLDADEELKRDDFFPNVLKALETDGKLCSTCAGVSIQTVIGAEDAVGAQPGWDYETLVATWGHFGLGTDAFGLTTTCYDILRTCLSMDMDSFVNREAGTCSFDNEKFTRLLSFAGNFQREANYERYGRTSADYTDIRLGSGKQMLQEKNICSFTDMLLCGYEFGSDVTFIGYPTLSGSGNMMKVSTLDTLCNLAISASSTHPQEAWQFLRRFFTEEYQLAYPYLPVNINAFNTRLSRVMEVTYVYDKTGKQVFDKRTGEPAIQSVDTVYLSNFAQVNLYPVSENDAAKLVTLMKNTDKVARDDSELCDIVCACAAEYFDGRMDLYATAAAVQERVSAYVTLPAAAEEAAAA